MNNYCWVAVEIHTDFGALNFEFGAGGNLYFGASASGKYTHRAHALDVQFNFRKGNGRHMPFLLHGGP